MSSLLGLGSSALGAYRSALSVTSNNISNVGVEGYSRQNIDLEQADTLKGNVGYLGNGVAPENVQRSYDQFLTRNLNSAISSGSHYDSYYEYASTIDQIVADPEVGMTPALGSFFSSLQDLSSAPASIPSRQVLHGEAEALVSRFNTIHQQMQDVRDQTKQELAAIVERVNGISRSVAELNARISESQSGSSASPNDLLDRRDILMKELSEYFGGLSTEQDGMANFYVGKGRALIVGNTYNELTLGNSQYREGDSVGLFMKQGNYNLDIASSVKGGRVGGIVDFTKEILNPAQNSLGQMAVTLAATLNAQHREGFGLGGESDTGKDFFNMGNMVVSEGISSLELGSVVAENTTSAELSVSIPMNNGDVVVGPAAVADVTGLIINGVQIADVTAGANSIETATNMVARMNEYTSLTGVTASVVEDNKIKLSSPETITVSKSSTGNIDASGMSEGVYRMVRSSIKNLTADDYKLSYQDSQYTITNINTQQKRVLSSDEVVNLKDTSVRGGLTHDGLTISLNIFDGDMEDGEEILFQPTRKAADNIKMSLGASEITSIAAADKANEPGTNSNTLAMANLQTEKIMGAGADGLPTAGIQDSYGQLVAEIGVQTHYAEVNRTAQDAVRKHAQSARDNLSAVNLDEEAANLMKYQQMFQASTRVISMADELFQAILGAVQ
jgi:flagellar hook-associated protein 1 FlgK